MSKAGQKFRGINTSGCSHYVLLMELVSVLQLPHSNAVNSGCPKHYWFFSFPCLTSIVCISNFCTSQMNHLHTNPCLRASQVAQTVKRLPAMRETWVRFLGWEDPLEKEMAIHSCLENPMDGGA